MDPSSPIPDFTSFAIQEIGALLFGLVFLFLYRQSKVIYFGLWSGAWVLRLLAAVFGFELLRTADTRWLAPYATFEFAFVIVLMSEIITGNLATLVPLCCSTVAAPPETPVIWPEIVWPAVVTIWSSATTRSVRPAAASAIRHVAVKIPLSERKEPITIKTI